MSWDGSTRRLVTFVLLGLCALSIRLAWGTSDQFPLNLGVPALAQSGGCSTVTTINGRGNQQSEPFEISGQTFVVDYEANAPENQSDQGYAFFNVVDENGGIIEPDTQDSSSDDPNRLVGSATFGNGPGVYNIEIAAEDADYTIDVRDCGASGGGSGGGDGSLLEAGGPGGGPVPPMPRGGCPAEYPVETGGVCHAMST